MKSFKNNLVWIIFMVFIIGALVMLLTTGPNPLVPPPPQYSAIVEPAAPTAPAAGLPKPETRLKSASRSNQLRRLARVQMNAGNLDRALALHRQSLALETKLDNAAGIAIQHDNIAAIYKAKGDTAKACNAWTMALSALGPAPETARFSLKNPGAGERLRGRVTKSREANACPQ
jgi:tetratricopeptide (TPR) repeat protein